MQNCEQLFLQKLSDAELLFDSREAIRAEREATSVVVKYFREISARELYLKHACSSLFQFATEKLGYCAASAQARINAMELVVALPEVEKKIESGELSLTAAAKVQSFFRAEKKAKKIYTEQQKLEVVQVCLSKSTREVERELASRNPEVSRIESVKPFGCDDFELRVTISRELEAKIRKLKGLMAHTQPSVRTEDLLERLVELGLEKLDPARKAARASARNAAKHKSRSCNGIEVGVTVMKSGLSKSSESAVRSNGERPINQKSNELRAHEVTEGITSDFQAPFSESCDHPTADVQDMPKDQESKQLRAHETKSRYVPAQVRHEVWQRNNGRGCEFASFEGAICGSHHALQMDHVYGFARGGDHAPENLQILCAAHNRYVWRVARGIVKEPSAAYEASARSGSNTQPKARCA